MENYPVSIYLNSRINYIQSQGNIECCTASATLLAAEMLYSNSNNTKFSRLYLYYMTRKLQGSLGEPGADLSYTLKALTEFGVPAENFWPFIDCNKEKMPDIRAQTEAAYYKLASYTRISTEEYKYYLTRNVPIIIGMQTGRMFWRLSGKLETQKYDPVDNLSNTVSTGHAVLIVGYDDSINGGSWIIANSVGPKWGFRGFGAISYKCNVDIGESYIINKFAGISSV
jgi:C1A family cysteine protease